MDANKRLYVIEVSTDYCDPVSHELVQGFVREQALGVAAFAGQIKDGVQPEIKVYTHDYINGHKDIPLLTPGQQDGTVPITMEEVA